MKFLQKMCLSRKQVMVGFRVALRSNMASRKGICCSSLAELRQKVEKKFPESIEQGVYTTDDTLVDEDEFLLSLPPQSLLVVGAPLARPHDAANVFDRLLTLLRETSGAAPVCREVLDFMQEDFQTKWKQMRAKVEETDLVLASSRADHPAWFADLSTNAKTKEEFMTKSCQARVRGYLAKAETQLRATVSKPGEMEQAEQVIREFKTRLRTNKFHGGYFDRGTDKATRICDESGDFLCQGKYSLPSCPYPEDHSINPYQSPEARVLFSTWNLDHLVERSRAVVPALVAAIQGKKARRSINIDYFYSLLFTRHNLRLVHIVCHDKGAHTSRTCDKAKYYIK